MTNPNPSAVPWRGIFKVPLLLAGGGAAAGFCAASCCGLPLLLGSAGLGSGWLITLAWFAAPYRVALLTAAGILLAGSVGAFFWPRRITYCAVRTSPAGWVAGAMLICILLVGSALVLLGYLYA